jgi:hypothetical protein
VNWGQWLPHTNWVAGHLNNADERHDTDLLINKERTLLAAYVPNAKIYKCPSDKSNLARSVSMNNRMNPVFHGTDIVSRMPDSSSMTSTDGFWLMPFPLPTIWPGKRS